MKPFVVSTKSGKSLKKLVSFQKNWQKSKIPHVDDKKNGQGVQFFLGCSGVILKFASFFETMLEIKITMVPCYLYQFYIL